MSMILPLCGLSVVVKNEENSSIKLVGCRNADADYVVL